MLKRVVELWTGTKPPEPVVWDTMSLEDRLAMVVALTTDLCLRQAPDATLQATIASLTAEKDAAERRVVELRAAIRLGMAAAREAWAYDRERLANAHEGWQACMEPWRLALVARDEALTALSQERTARVEAEAVLKKARETWAALDNPGLMLLDALRDRSALTLALEESRTARQAAEALVGWWLEAPIESAPGRAETLAEYLDLLDAGGDDDEVQREIRDWLDRAAALTPTAPEQRATEEV